MTYEDFDADYTEVDPDGHWSQSAVRSTATGVTRDEISYVYKDFGVGHFDECEHLFDMRCTTRGITGSTIATYAQSNTLSEYPWAAGFAVRFYTVAAAVRLYLTDIVSGTTDYYIGAEDTTYYCTLKRYNSTTLTLKIYSDAARTSLVDTLTLPAIDDSQYRYIYGGASDNIADDTKVISGWMENLDLQESVDPTESVVISRDFHVGGI